MVTHAKVSRCRGSSNKRRRGANSQGTVLITIMVVAVLLLIGLTAALPSVYQEGQREREEETIFRGIQYARAVALFHKQIGRYPVSVKELMQTNGMRFLRQEYADPLDPKGKWRFIHVNAAGVLLDSKNQPMNNANNPNPAGLGANSSQSGVGSSLLGSSSFGTSSFGSSGSDSSSFGSSSFGTSSFGSSSFGSSSFGSSGTSSSMFGSSTSGSSSSGSSMFGNPNDIQGAFIAGVAPTSHHTAIKVWEKHQHYDEWEFIGINMGNFGIQVGLPGGGGAAGGGPSQGANSSGFGSSGSGFMNSSSSSGQSSFGFNSNNLGSSQN